MESRAGLKRLKARRRRQGGPDGHDDGTMDENADDDGGSGNEAEDIGWGDEKYEDQEESKRGLLAGQALRNHRIANAFNRVRGV